MIWTGLRAASDPSRSGNGLAVADDFHQTADFIDRLARARGHAGTHHAKTSYVVDGDRAVRRAVRDALRSFGWPRWSVTEAECVQDLLTLWNPDSADLLLINLHVDSGKGLELIRSFGESRPSIVAWCRSDSVGRMMQELGPKVDAYIEEPISEGLILVTLTALGMTQASLTGPQPFVPR